MLTPTRIYARDCLALAGGCDVHAFAHVTGGGLAANLARVLPAHADAVVDRATWRPQPVFGLLAVLAEYEPARGAATALAFGLDFAAYLEAPGFGSKKTVTTAPHDVKTQLGA